MNPIRSFVLFVLLVLPLAVAFAAPASAVELYRAVALPDAGNGGSANGFSVPSGADRMPVVGEMRLPDGDPVPVHWRYDLAGGGTTLTELPIPPGHTGAANAITVESTGRCLAVGTLIDAGGLSYAAYWREEEPDAGEAPAWLGAVPLGDLGNGSRANGLTPNLGSSRGDVTGGSRAQKLLPGLGSSRGDVVGDMTLAGGRTVPVKWTIDLDTGAVAREQLPVPPGAEGSAHSIARAENGDLVAAGTLLIDGLASAARWTSSGAGWSLELLATPSGAESGANGLVMTGGIEIVSTGATCDAAGCFATLWQDDGSPQNLHAGADFDGSVASAVFGGDGALAAAGTLSDPSGDAGALFLPEADLAVAVEQLLVDAAEVHDVRAIGDGGRMAGVGRGDPCDLPTVDCGIVIIPVLAVVAQGLDMLDGSVSAGDVTRTWQEDGESLQLAPAGAGVVTASFEARQIGSVGPLSALTLEVSVRGLSNDEDAKWSVAPEVWNAVTGGWDDLDPVEATTALTAFSVGVPDDPNHYFDASQSCRVRFRIEQSAGSGPWSFDFDALEIKVEEPPA